MMTLEQWSQNAWLRRSETTIAEIQSLFAVVDRDLADAHVDGLSPDGGFQHAYDAGLQLCVIAIRASGYDLIKGQGKHKRAIEAMPLVMGESMDSTSRHLERCSRLRGLTVYERTGVVS